VLDSNLRRFTGAPDSDRSGASCCLFFPLSSSAMEAHFHSFEAWVAGFVVDLRGWPRGPLKLPNRGEHMHETGGEMHRVRSLRCYAGIIRVHHIA
jgi:hypothetical protein